MVERSQVVEQSPDEDDDDDTHGTLRAVLVGVAVLLCQVGLKKLGLSWDDFVVRIVATIPGVLAGVGVVMAVEWVMERLEPKGEAKHEELEQRLREFEVPPPPDARDEWRQRL